MTRLSAAGEGVHDVHIAGNIGGNDLIKNKERLIKEIRRDNS